LATIVKEAIAAKAEAVGVIAPRHPRLSREELFAVVAITNHEPVRHKFLEILAGTDRRIISSARSAGRYG